MTFPTLFLALREPKASPTGEPRRRPAIQTNQAQSSLPIFRLGSLSRSGAIPPAKLRPQRQFQGNRAKSCLIEFKKIRSSQQETQFPILPGGGGPPAFRAFRGANSFRLNPE